MFCSQFLYMFNFFIAPVISFLIPNLIFIQCHDLNVPADPVPLYTRPKNYLTHSHPRSSDTNAALSAVSYLYAHGTMKAEMMLSVSVSVQGSTKLQFCQMGHKPRKWCESPTTQLQPPPLLGLF